MVTVDPGVSVDCAPPADHRAFPYALSGIVTIAGSAFTTGQVAWSDPTGEDDSVLGRPCPTGTSRPYSARPIGQSVALGGRFVMNVPGEIETAYRDLRGAGSARCPPRPGRPATADAAPGQLTRSPRGDDQRR